MPEAARRFGQIVGQGSWYQSRDGDRPMTVGLLHLCVGPVSLFRLFLVGFDDTVMSVSHFPP